MLHVQARIVLIDSNDEGQRLDNFLFKTLKKVPKSHIYQLIRKGQVRINSKRCKPQSRLQLNDKVRIPPILINEAKSEPIIPLDKIDILYDDDVLVAINKPAGLAVHGGTGQSSGLIERLRVTWPQYKFLELVHRLDRDTSGCIILAKKRQALTQLQASWRAGEVYKTYHALVSGSWPKRVNMVNLPLKKQSLGSGERIVRVDHVTGQAASTTFNILKKWPDATLLEVHPKTGRTHQIRVHCLSQKHPIVGDEKYMRRELRQQCIQQLNIRRMCLHAYQLRFTHPLTGVPVNIVAEYDATQFLGQLAP